MKRLPVLAFAFLVCALALSMLAHPRPAEAACYMLCDYWDSGYPYTTSTAIGKGSDCATADAALTSQLQQQATAFCGGTYCRFTKVITQSCTQTSAGQYQVQGYATFNCKYRVCEP